MVFMVGKSNWQGNTGSSYFWHLPDKAYESAYDFCYSCSMYMSN